MYGLAQESYSHQLDQIWIPNPVLPPQSACFKWLFYFLFPENVNRKAFKGNVKPGWHYFGRKMVNMPEFIIKYGLIICLKKSHNKLGLLASVIQYSICENFFWNHFYSWYNSIVSGIKPLRFSPNVDYYFCITAHP